MTTADGPALPQTPPPSGGRMSPVVLIVIVAVGVLVLGGVVFFIGRATAGGGADTTLAEQQVAEESTEVITPIPDGDEPLVEPIPDVPTLEPIPEAPVEEPMPDETLPAETLPAEAVEEAITEEQAGDASTVSLANGISAVVPAGWEAQTLDEATVVIGTDGGGAMLGIYTAPPGATGSELISFYVQETLSTEMTDLEVTQPEPLALDVPSVTSAATNGYQGTYVSQQGSFPLEGMLWAFIRADGTALVIDGYWAPGVDITDQLADIAVSALNTL